MISAKNRRHISRILPFGFIWLFFGLVFSSVEFGFLGNSPVTPSTGQVYDAQLSFLIACTISPIYGLIIGSIEVLFVSRLVKSKGLAKKIVLKIILYIFVFLGFTFIASPIVFISQFDSNILDPRVWEETFYMFSTFALWSGWIYAMAVLSVCIFYAEISNNIGQGVLNNFLTGKYHKPIEEERIFMFLDMKSSTTIAEQLGHVKYFELLSEYYSDFTEAIINSSGEIYQYIGDEVVVSWETTKGIRNNNCLECFRMMKKSLKKRTDFYKDKFGVVPSFKAGMHVGLVTCGEIGVLKKEIIFTGDILNTTARIQSLCNEYEVDLIISESLIKQLDLKKEHPIQALGENELRGRTKHINLYSLNL